MPIDTIIIAAGGRGRRFFGDDNEHSLGKPCIVYAGKPLLWYVCASAKQAGISKFCISYNQDNLSVIQDIVVDLRLDATLRMTTPGFRGVPGVFKDKINDLAIFACGHHIIPWKHFSALKNSGIGTSLYPLPAITASEKCLIPYEVATKLKEKSGPTHNDYYIESPYIIDRQLADFMSTHHTDTRWQNIYFEKWKNGQVINFTIADFPSEFDWTEQYALTVKLLENQQSLLGTI